MNHTFFLSNRVTMFKIILNSLAIFLFLTNTIFAQNRTFSVELSTASNYSFSSSRQTSEIQKPFYQDMSRLEVLNDYRLLIANGFCRNRLYTAIGISLINSKQSVSLDDPSKDLYFQAPTIPYKNVMAHVQLGINNRLADKWMLTSYASIGYSIIMNVEESNRTSFTTGIDHDRIDSIWLRQRIAYNHNFFNIGLGCKAAYRMYDNVRLIFDVEMLQGLQRLFAVDNYYQTYSQRNFIGRHAAIISNRGSKIRGGVGVRIHLF